MAISLDFKNNENRQKLMMLILAVVAAVTFFIVYNYFFRESNVIPLATENVPESLSVVQGGQLDTSVLSNKAFQSLKKNGDYPVEVKDSELGRDNPFTPF